jgi:hypothetical protein
MQCAIAVFDGLLPEPHNTNILKLLFDLAHWHALAKLHMHIDPTLDIFSQVTTSLGHSLRTFRDKTCVVFPTRELERERAARDRRESKHSTNSVPESPKSKPTTRAPNTVESSKSKSKKRGSSARQPVELNLRTYKLHALGDYVHTIRRFGTTDSYSTQSVS